MASSVFIDEYKVGVICALPLERTAVESMFDNYHDLLPTASGHDNTYSFGRIGKHNVVLASLGSGSYGTVSASGVANDMRRSFPGVKFGLMVEIAGGAPRPTTKDGDMRLLGNVVVGCVNGVPSVINYRLGKETSTGFDIRSELAEPPEAIQRAVSALKTQHQREGPTYLKHLDADVGTAKLIKRTEDSFADYPTIHYGTIASADTLMKEATERDAVKRQRKADVLCFEMEAAGIVKGWPCLVVCGICDYSTSHKNDAWQNFGAATAAAYAKDLLLRIPPEMVTKSPRANDVIDEGKLKPVCLLKDSLQRNISG
ncbi:hypothetical protein LTR56_027675 [Elasticomyces elasticus]|nr:hypothetical protein LTR56_027675 [Elasticomyces elasticus]